MKIKHVTTIALTALAALGARAGFEQFTGPNGAMNVYNNVGGNQGDWLWYSAWGLPDLQSITTDDRTFELKPNINNYNPEDAYWSDGAGDGNKWLQATTLFELALTSEAGAGLTFNVDAFDLNDRYSATAFVKVLDPSNDWQPVVSTSTPITGTGSNITVVLDFNGQPMDGKYLQLGWEMQGLNANPATDWGGLTVTATDIYADTGDDTAPTPDPMTFAVAPYGASDSAVSMTATTAADDMSDVEYYFTCVSGAGHDSDWQSETTYTDTGLAPDTAYAYTVRARDTSSAQNETAASASASATTLPTDVTAPTPDPMTFAATEASSVSVKLTATTAADDSAVQYYFTCVGGAGNDSGWQSSPVYYDTGLLPNSNYTYTVTARDLSAATNTTAASSAMLVTTLGTARAPALSDTLTGYTGDSTVGATYHELARNGWEIGSTSADKRITFDGAGAAFGPAATWESRNLLRTISEDYGDHDFEVYATFAIEGTTEQAAFIGIGQGLVEGAWGVPDMELVGVNAINAEIQYNWCKMWSWTNGVSAVLDETTGISTVTNRVKMVHDATAQTVTISVDTDYDGGAFVEDRVLATHSTVGVWVDAPQRVYIAAGAGVSFKDVEIIADATAQPVELGVAGITDGGGLILSWDGVPGQVYEAQYTTDLATPGWTTDPSLDEIHDYGGTMMATSTVSEAQAFYRFIEK